MPISGALPGNAAFLSSALNSQRYLNPANDSRWHDDRIAIAGSDDAVTCIHGNLVLFLDGRLNRRRELSTRLGTTGHSPLLDVLEAYRRWGDEFPRYLDGDFALALWDAGKHRLLLARDPEGHRTLHYWVQGGQFRFASEARGLVAHGDIPLVANQRKIAQWLNRIPENSGSTYFRNISCVPAGHTAVWERERVTVRDFWQPSNIPELRLSDPREYAEGVRCVLEDSVRERIADCSAVGCQLSGGLDSSSVTATAAGILQDRGGTVSAFTAVPAVSTDDAIFPGRFCDESAHAAATAALYPNIEHVLIPNVSGSLFHTLDQMTSAAECPQLNPGNSCWIRAICAEAAGRGLSALLTGVKGNFTISWDGRRALFSLIASGRIPTAMRLAGAMRRNGRTWPAVFRAGVGPLLPFSLHRILNIARGDVFEMEIGSRREFAKSAGLDLRKTIGINGSLDGRSLRIRSIRRGDPGGHRSALRRLTGIEQMDPTADRRVMEFCLSVPEEHYCASGSRRSLIRDAMAGRLPAKVLNERRRGKQSADLLFHMTREKAEFEAELKRLRKVDLAARCLNLPLLESLLQAWPSPPYQRADYERYGIDLMHSISMGRFIRRLEEGALFRDQLPVGTRSA
jgi:asparagine synthase (glutamine-hydrolysing)